MSLVFWYELEVIPDFAQEHFWYFDPVGAAGRAEQSLQLCATFVERDSLVDFLRRKHENTMWNIAMRKA